MGINQADQDDCDVTLSPSYSEPFMVQGVLRSLRCALSKGRVGEIVFVLALNHKLSAL